MLSNQPRDAVDRLTRREGHDESDGFVGISLSVRNVTCAEQNKSKKNH